MQKHVSSKHTFPKGATCGQKHNRVTLWAKNYLHYIQNYFWLDMQTDTKSARLQTETKILVFPFPLGHLVQQQQQACSVKQHPETLQDKKTKYVICLLWNLPSEL